MTQLKITIGAHRDWPLQCWNEGAATPATFAATDGLSAYVYRGQDQAALFAPQVAWYTAGGTQTGYGQGQVQATIASAQSAALEGDGEYALAVWRTPSGSTETDCVWSGRLLALPAAGSAGQTLACYNTYADMLRYGPWVKQAQDADSDQEGFYSQRLEAREWFDGSVINNYRGASIGNFDTTSTLAFAFGGGVGWRRGVGPSPSMVQWLGQDLLIVRPQVVRACAYKALSIVGLAQAGTNNRLAGFGAYCRDMADRELTAITAEVDLNSDGVGEIFIALGSTNTLLT